MKTKTITKYFRKLNDGREVELPFNPETDDISETLRDSEIILGCIVRDDDAPNPRKEFDNVGTMVCWHLSYCLGDVQPYESPEDFRRALAYDAATEEQRSIFDDDDDFEGDPTMVDEDALIEQILEEKFTTLPLFLYDHGSLTMCTGSFNDPWDSGQVGFIYVSKEKAKWEWGAGFYKNADGEIVREQTDTPVPDEEGWAHCLKAEVETYDQYLTGDVYGVCVWTYDSKTLELKDRDECWGYYGSDYAEQELKSQMGVENV